KPDLKSSIDRKLKRLLKIICANILTTSILLARVRGKGQDDFSLGDALLEDDLDLSHALDLDDPKPHPPANPRDTEVLSVFAKSRTKQIQMDTDTFDDSDLFDGNFPKGGSDGSGSNERKGPTPNDGQEEQGFTLRQYFDMAFSSEKCIQTSLFSSASPGAIAGIISAVGAAVIGTVSSFIAYQKKKLCFKQNDEENVNMQSHRGAQSEPPGHHLKHTVLYSVIIP
ncbi:hypothetical protein IHE44_0005238, partial [Lamprotornis superbus]